MRFLTRILSRFVMNGVLTTYDDGSKLEDVMAQVLITNPPDTPFVSGIKKTRAAGTLHEWLEDSIAAATHNATVEGAAIAYQSVTAPQRVNNYTQIFTRSGQVSSTQQWVNHAGVASMEKYQEQKLIKAIAEDIEKAVLTGSRNAGDATAGARRLAGALNFVTTNATAVASGTKLSESFYNGLCELAYGQKGRVDEVYVSMRLKRVISSYTTGGTRTVSAEDKRLVNAVDVYESDLGVQKVFASRHMPSGANTSAILGIESDKWALAVGEPVKILTEVSQNIHGCNIVARGEVTLEARAQSHCFKATGLSDLFVV